MADLITIPHDGHDPDDTCPACPHTHDRHTRSIRRPVAGETVTTAEQLDALDKDAVVLDPDGHAWQRVSLRAVAQWHSARGSRTQTWLARYGPLLVLYSPNSAPDPDAPTNRSVAEREATRRYWDDLPDSEKVTHTRAEIRDIRSRAFVAGWEARGRVARPAAH